LNVFQPLLMTLLAMTAVSFARATTVIPPNFNKLVSQADYIVRAVVKSVNSELSTDGGKRHIVTKVELDVQEVISGTPPQPLVLEMLGGKVGVDEMVVDGAPKFVVGDEDILFVHGNGRQFNPLVALMYGRYPILEEAGTGRRYVARANGLPLRSEQEVDKPMVAPAVNAQASPPPALSPIEFIGRIHAAVRQNSGAQLEN